MQRDFYGTRKPEAQGEKYVGGSDYIGRECRASDGDAKIYADGGQGPAQWTTGEGKERRHGTNQRKRLRTTCPDAERGVAVADGDREITNVRLAVTETLAAAMLPTAIAVDVAAMLVLLETLMLEEGAADTLEVALGARAGLPLTLNSTSTSAEVEPITVFEAEIELDMARDAVDESKDGVAVCDALVAASLADGDEGGDKDVLKEAVISTPLHVWLLVCAELSDCVQLELSVSDGANACELVALLICVSVGVEDKLLPRDDTCDRVMPWLVVAVLLLAGDETHWLPVLDDDDEAVNDPAKVLVDETVLACEMVPPGVVA